MLSTSYVLGPGAATREQGRPCPSPQEAYILTGKRTINRRTTTAPKAHGAGKHAGCRQRLAGRTVLCVNYVFVHFFLLEKGKNSWPSVIFRYYLITDVPMVVWIYCYVFLLKYVALVSTRRVKHRVSAWKPPFIILLVRGRYVLSSK